MPSPIFWQRLSTFLNYPVETFFTPDDTPSEPVTDLKISLKESSILTSVLSQDTLVPATDQRMTLYTSEELQILLEQQRLALAEQRLTFHRNHLQYVHDLLEILLPLLDPNATQNLRLRLLEHLFRQIEQTQQETHQEFAPLLFPQVKHAFELANQEEQAVRSKESNGNDCNKGKETDTSNYRLRSARERRGWTHRDVAIRLDLPDSHTIGRWERGVHKPSHHYRQRLCDIFHMSMDELGLI